MPYLLAIFPLLNDSLQGNKVIEVASKSPVITIQNVQDYNNEEEFINGVKAQNQNISQKIEKGDICF